MASLGDTSHCLKRALARALVERRDRVSSGDVRLVSVAVSVSVAVVAVAVAAAAAVAVAVAAAVSVESATGDDRSVRTRSGPGEGVASSAFFRGASIESSVRCPL